MRTPRRAAALLAVAASVAALLTGCSLDLRGRPAPTTSQGATTAAVPDAPGTRSQANRAAPGAVARDAAAVAELLTRRARAVESRDRAAFTATLDDPRSAFGLRQLAVFDNLAKLPLATFRYASPRPAPALAPARLHELGLTRPADAVAVSVEGAAQLAGYDRVPRSYEASFTAVRRPHGWRLADDSDGASQPQLWDLPEIGVVHSGTILVVAAKGVTGVADYLRLGQSAVADVDAVWRRPWNHRLVLVVPSSAAQMAAQLGQDTGSVAQVAAVTDGPLGPDGRAGADHVVVNPEAFHGLQPVGRQVVITHEATHVAVRATTTAAVPLWLSEGFADYVGYRGVGVAPQQIAAPLLSRVRAGHGPGALPADADFDPSRSTIGPSYNAAWLAVRLIAQRYGVEALTRFYATAATAATAATPATAATTATAPGGGGGAPAAPRTAAQSRAAVEAAFSSVLGTSETAFTREWLALLRQLAH